MMKFSSFLLSLDHFYFFLRLFLIFFLKHDLKVSHVTLHNSLVIRPAYFRAVCPLVDFSTFLASHTVRKCLHRSLAVTSSTSSDLRPRVCAGASACWFSFFRIVVLCPPLFHHPRGPILISPSRHICIQHLRTSSQHPELYPHV